VKNIRRASTRFVDLCSLTARASAVGVAVWPISMAALLHHPGERPYFVAREVTTGNQRLGRCGCSPIFGAGWRLDLEAGTATCTMCGAVTDVAVDVARAEARFHAVSGEQHRGHLVRSGCRSGKSLLMAKLIRANQQGGET
jgi:hypothetical protein